MAPTGGWASAGSGRRAVFFLCLVLAVGVPVVLIGANLFGGNLLGGGSPSKPTGAPPGQVAPPPPVAPTTTKGAAPSPSGSAASVPTPGPPQAAAGLESAADRGLKFVQEFTNVSSGDRIDLKVGALESYVAVSARDVVLARWTKYRSGAGKNGSLSYRITGSKWVAVTETYATLRVDGDTTVTVDGKSSTGKVSYIVGMTRGSSGWSATSIADPSEGDAGS